MKSYANNWTYVESICILLLHFVKILAFPSYDSGRLLGVRYYFED